MVEWWAVAKHAPQRDGEVPLHCSCLTASIMHRPLHLFFDLTLVGVAKAVYFVVEDVTNATRCRCVETSSGVVDVVPPRQEHPFLRGIIFGTGDLDLGLDAWEALHHSTKMQVGNYLLAVWHGHGFLAHKVLHAVRAVFGWMLLGDTNTIRHQSHGTEISQRREAVTGR
jgi:hypothetical protein